MTTGVTRLVLSGTAAQPSRELVLDGRLVIARAATPFGSTEARAVLEDVRAVGTRRVHHPWLLVVGAVSCLFLLWHARTLLAASETSSSELEVLDDLRVWAASVSAAIGPILTYLLTRHVVLAIGTERRELTVALRGDETELKDALAVAGAIEARALEARRVRVSRRSRALAPLEVPTLPAVLGGNSARFDRQRLLVLGGGALAFVLGVGGYFAVRPGHADETWPPENLADAAPWAGGAGSGVPAAPTGEPTGEEGFYGDDGVVYGGEMTGEDMAGALGCGDCDFDCDGLVSGEEIEMCAAGTAPVDTAGYDPTGAAPATAGLPTPPARELTPVSFEASRFLVEGRIEYVPRFAFDGNNDTCWAARDPVPGVEFLEACFDAPVTIERLELTTGFERFNRAGDLFVRNAHVAEAHVLVDGVEHARFTAGDAQRWAVVPLDAGSTGRCVRIVFDRAWPGERWQDLSISEVHLWGR